MIVKKITTGWVIQVYDTENEKFISQKFVAGDEVEYEDEEGEKVKYFESYLPFDMVQPMTKIKWQIDNCPDAKGFWTIRPYDGTENGDTSQQPIATVADYDLAKLIVADHNKEV
jgi:hypothetical protein